MQAWLTLHQLQIFVTIAREGGFSKAAAVLSLSEPSVSRQVKLLERALGIELLDRGPAKPVRLTEAGRKLLTVCDDVLERLAAGLHEVDAVKRGQTGRVMFGTSGLFYSHLFPLLYAPFLKLCPGIEVAVETGTEPSQIEAVLRGKLDLMLSVSGVDDPRVASVRLAGLDMVLIGPPEHQLASDEIVPFERLSTECFIPSGTARGALAKGILTRRAAELGVHIRLGWEAIGTEAQISAVRSGFGIALLPHYTVASMIAAGILSVLSVEGFPVRLEWFLVSSASGLSAPASAFQAYLLEHSSALEIVSLYRVPAASTVSRN